MAVLPPLRAPERVTLGVLKHFPRLPRGRREGLGRELAKSPNGIKRYSTLVKVQVFNTLADWLGFQPALCRETTEVWEEMGWKSNGCNCTPNQIIGWPCPEVRPVNPKNNGKECLVSRIAIKENTTHG
jgi:hypothetical protein